MENVLDVYHRPYDPKNPVVCMDESSKQCVKEVRPPLQLAEGRPKRYDTEYERNGTANIFLACEPLKGKRTVQVTERRTKTDWAYFIKDLVDHYHEAEKVVLVMDNLNTHSVGSLYDAFSPGEAKRISDKLEIHFTPKHGSWLNVAEIELSILSRQCLNQRIPDRDNLSSEVGAWTSTRNQQASKIDWQFDIDTARIKLRRLYPVQSMDFRPSIKT